MISYAFVDGFTGVARDAAIDRLKRAIAKADGVIVDFAFYGQDAIRLSVALDVGSLHVLRDELAEAEVELFEQSATELDTAGTMTSTRPIVAMLHIAFLQPEGVAPAGPGPLGASHPS